MLCVVLCLIFIETCVILTIIGDMKIIAHRGWSAKYPENTMLAFEKAVEVKTDGIELDVHLSKDGEVMIQHDEALLRTSGKEGVISDYTRSELERISAGKTKNDDFGFTPIPSLEEYLDFISKTNVFTNIELKTAPMYYPGIEEKVMKLINRYSYIDRVIFSSFNWLSIMKIKMMEPTTKAGVLIASPAIKNIGYELADIGFDTYHPDFDIVDENVVFDCHRNGIEINVWTVNDKSKMEICDKWNIDGLITNEPDVAISLFR